MSSEADRLATGIAREFRKHVLEEYLPRIHQCVAQLTVEQLWARPGPHNNSVANLVQHLAGNTRQWILAGIGGEADGRDRDREFQGQDPSSGPTGDEMVEELTTTVVAAAGIVDRLGPEELLAVRRFQSRWDETCLAAVLHVMEHFSGHAGQIYAYTKQVRGVDLKFWDL